MTNSFSDNYEILGQIGAGGMSVIFKGRQIALNKMVAIKMLHSHLLNDQSVRRFQQEAKAVSSLRHPNVIAVHDFGLTENGQPFMVMDLIEGRTLSDLITEVGALPLPFAVEIFLPVCDALHEAHSQGILHRDLKPGNIMITDRKDGCDVHLLDFGLAKVLDTGPGGIAQKLTQTGELFGSPLYMSPEQCMGRTLDQRSDIYSLGCVFYESLVGWPPLQGDTVIDTIFMHLNDAAVSINEARTDINFPQSVVNLVDRLLAKQPEERYQSISEVKDELLNIQSGAFAAPIKSAQKIERIGPSAPVLVAIGGAVLCAVGTCLFIVAWMTFQEAQRIEQMQPFRPAISSVPRLQAAALTLGAIRNTDRGMPHPDKDGYVDLSTTHHTVVEWKQLLSRLASNPDLRSINLAYTNVTDVSELSESKSLTELRLDYAPLSAEAVAHVAEIPSLEKLSLSNTKVNNDVLQALGRMPHLRNLDLRDTEVGDEGMQAFSQCKTLRELAISGTNVGDLGLQIISHLPLTGLDMWETKISAGGLEPLADCQSLTRLCISAVKLNDQSMNAISKLSNLEYLQLYHIPTLRDKQLRYLTSLKKLEKLYIEDCPLTDDSAQFIVKLPLKNLAMNQMNLTDLFLKKIIPLQSLEQLWLQDVHTTDSGMNDLAELKNLQKLYLAKSAITHTGLLTLANKAGKLKYLKLDFCPDATRSGVLPLRTRKINPVWTDLHYQD